MKRIGKAILLSLFLTVAFVNADASAANHRQHEHTARYDSKPGKGKNRNEGLQHRLDHMVRHATKGCKDISVWRVNRTTYAVRYRKGRHFYTRYLYPLANRYGEPVVIGGKWQPRSAWERVPSIQLNINL